jgi:hypothetical protein
MAEYKPNANRQVKGGKAMVSADELKSFRSTYGEDKTLRDLLNMDKGLTRKGEAPNGPKDASLGQDMTSKESKDALKSLEKIQSPPKKSFEDQNDRRTRQKTNEVNTDVSDMTYRKGGKVSSASSRADGCAQRGKTRGMIK